MPMIRTVEQRHSLGGRACPQFGGGGGSSSNATTNTNTDSRISLQSGTATSGNNNNITVLDGEAVSKAFGFGNTALLQSMDLAKASNAIVADSLTKAYSDAKGRGAMTDWVILGAVAVAGLIAVISLKKKG